MKLTLDVNALSKLMELAGPDFILELQQGVLENCMKRHVKSLTSSALYTGMQGLIAAEVKRTVGEVKDSGWSKSVTLTPELLEELRSIANQAIRKSIDGFLKEIRETLQKDAEAHVSRLRSEMSQMIELRFNSEMKKMVDAGVKEKMLQVHKSIEGVL